MRKKIAYIGIKALPANAGVDSVVEAVISGLDRERFEPVVYVNRALVPEEVVIPNARLVRIKTMQGKYFNATSLFLFSALHALFRGDYDLINVHSVETCFVLPILRLRYKVVATAHGLLSKEPPELSKWGKAKPLLRLTELPFMHLSNRRTSVSKPDKDYLEDRYHKDVAYLPNGIGDLRPDAAAARDFLAGYGLEPGKYILFTAGRIVPRKGCHLLLEALREMDDDVKVLVVGDMSHVPEYAERLRGLADDRVRFCGFVSDKPLLFGLVSLSSLFVFPTTYEAMAMTLLEVAAVGTPLLASDIPENREVLPEQALFFRSGDSADLREKLRWALANPDGMERLAAAARRHVAENYRWPGIIATYENIYDELTGGVDTPAPETASRVAAGRQGS